MAGQRNTAENPSNQVDAPRAAEAALVARCLAGETDAFKAVYDAHATRLYNLAYRMCGTTGEAEELLQEVFLLAFRKLSGFKGQSSLGTWLYRLATNLCLDHVRGKQGKIGRATVSLDDDERGAPARPRGTAVDSVAHKLDLERAIEQLPPSYRAAFLLHDVEGFEHHEIADMLDIAEGTSKSLVHKARLRLRTFLVGAPANGELRA